MSFETICPLSFKKPRRRVGRVFIHCSAASRHRVNAEEVDIWHRQKGWSGIGYHYFIKTDGTLESGRDLKKMPAAQLHHNKGTIAICLNGLMLEDFTEEQFIKLRLLCNKINYAYSGDIEFRPHNHVSAKACPVFDIYNVLNVDRVTGKML